MDPVDAAPPSPTAEGPPPGPSASGDLQAGVDRLGTELPEAIWALWSEIDRMRQELDEDRRGRDGGAAAATAAVADAVQSLRREVEALARPAEGPEVTFPYALMALPGQFEQLREDLDADRTERERRDEALSAAFGDEIKQLRDELVQERAERDATEAALPDAVRVEVEKLRVELREERRLGESRDARALPKVIRAALDELRFQLEEERRQREARDASIPPALQSVHDELANLRSTIADDRTEQQRREATGAESLVAEVDRLRSDLAEVPTAADELRSQLGQLREELVDDWSEWEARDTAAAAATQALRSQLEALRAELGEGWREDRKRETTVSDVVRSQLDQVRAELAEGVAAVRNELATLQAQLSEDRRQHEALAFRLPEAAEDLRGQLAEVRGHQVEGLRELEEKLKATVGGANTWFVRTRDELVERMDQLAAAVAEGQAPKEERHDLGIAEAMVEVLELLRFEVQELQGGFATVGAALLDLRDELTTLSRRPNLTAAHVRRIVTEARSDPPPTKGSAANGRAAKATKRSPSPSSKPRPRRPA